MTNYLMGLGPSGFTNLDATDFVVLNNSIFTPSFSEPDVLEHKAVDGVKNFIALGDYSNFRAIIYLWKWQSTLDQFRKLMTYNHQNVFFFPHIHKNVDDDFQGVPMQHESVINTAFAPDSKYYHAREFHITLIRPFYFSYEDFREKKVAVEMEFKATGYTNLAYNLA